MARVTGAGVLTAVLSLALVAVCAQVPAMAPSPALGRSIPVVNIPARVDLPTLPVIRDFLNLTMAPARIMVSPLYLSDGMSAFE